MSWCRASSSCASCQAACAPARLRSSCLPSCSCPIRSACMHAKVGPQTASPGALPCEAIAFRDMSATAHWAMSGVYGRPAAHLQQSKAVCTARAHQQARMLPGIAVLAAVAVAVAGPSVGSFLPVALLRLRRAGTQAGALRSGRGWSSSRHTGHRALHSPCPADTLPALAQSGLGPDAQAGLCCAGQPHLVLHKSVFGLLARPVLQHAPGLLDGSLQGSPPLLVRLLRAGLFRVAVRAAAGAVCVAASLLLVSAASSVRAWGQCRHKTSLAAAAGCSNPAPAGIAPCGCSQEGTPESELCATSSSSAAPSGEAVLRCGDPPSDVTSSGTGCSRPGCMAGAGGKPG